MKLLYSALLSPICAGVMLTACASSEPKSANTQKAISTIPNVAAPTSGLTAQQLQPGECGLFLWTKGLPNTLIFFSKAGTNAALMKSNNTEEPVTLTSAAGDIFGQFMTRQTYQAPNSVTVSLSFNAGKTMEDGQRIDNGRLTRSSAEGWETIIPVVGVRACQPG